MCEQRAYKGFWEKRERFELTPPRYSQVASIASVRKRLMGMSKSWRMNRKWINYVDLGCGDCRGTRIFADFLQKIVKMRINTIGVDASGKCEDQCRELNIQFLRLDLGSESVPLRDCHVVTLFETIEHVFDTDFLLQTIRDVLSRDGILFVSTLNVVCWKNRILVPLGIQPINTEVSTRKLSYGYRLDFLKKRINVWQPAGHIRPFTLHSLKDLLEDNGFTIISSHGIENWRGFKFLEHVAKNMCTSILVLAKPA